MAISRGVREAGQVLGTGLQNLANALMAVRKMQFQLAVQKAQQAARKQEIAESRAWEESQAEKKQQEALKNLAVQLGLFNEALAQADTPTLRSTISNYYAKQREAELKQREATNKWLGLVGTLLKDRKLTLPEWWVTEVARRQAGVKQSPLPLGAVTKEPLGGGGRGGTRTKAPTLGGLTIQQIRTGITATRPVSLKDELRKEVTWYYPSPQDEAIHKELLIADKLYKMGITDQGKLREKGVNYHELMARLLAGEDMDTVLAEYGLKEGKPKKKTKEFGPLTLKEELARERTSKGRPLTKEEKEAISILVNKKHYTIPEAKKYLGIE